VNLTPFLPPELAATVAELTVEFERMREAN